jgi:hypothetical protein
MSKININKYIVKSVNSNNLQIKRLSIKNTEFSIDCLLNDL